MKFDFETFEEMAASVYQEENLYTLEEYLQVFRWYFQTYEQHTGRPHPFISREQIARIMLTMPTDGAPRALGETIYYRMYRFLIPMHFHTKYRRCDYNINHFFSGKVRLYRMYELEAGREDFDPLEE